MGFKAPFSRPMQPPFGPGLQAAAASSDWWLTGGIPSANCIAAYQPKGAASYAASKVNLANPGTYDATEGLAPDWDTTNGWDFIGHTTSRRLWTGITPENDQTWSMIIRFDDSLVNQSQYIAGSVNSAGSAAFFVISPRRGATDDMIWGNGGILIAGSRQSSGVSAIAGQNCYHNKTDYGNVASGWDAVGIEIAIGGFNNNNGPGQSFSTTSFDGRIQAMAIYDIDISAYISGLTDAMNAL